MGQMIPGPRAEGKDTLKVRQQVGSPSYSPGGGFDAAGMRRIKQLGVDGPGYRSPRSQLEDVPGVGPERFCRLHPRLGVCLVRTSGPTIWPRFSDHHNADAAKSTS